MLKFTVPQASASAVSTASEGSLVIDSIIFYNGSDVLFTKRSADGDYIGNVVRDESGIGDYVVVDLEDATSSGYTITKIVLASSELKSGGSLVNNGIIAESPDVSVVKASNKQLKLRITAQFDGATKCTFDSISIGLPYATKFRQGVIRLASAKDDPTEPGLSQDEITQREQQLNSVVYTANDTISKIEEYVQSADQYVPWDTSGSPAAPVVGSVTVDHLTIADDVDNPTGTATITATTSSNVTNLVINNNITGSAVSSSPTYGSTSIATSAVDSSNKLVNETYISNIYSNSVAASDSADARKLVTGYAVRDYCEGTNNNFVHKTGDESISGVKTFNSNIVTGNGVTISGGAVYNTYASGTWASGHTSELPTVGATKDAIDAGDAAVTTAFQSADTTLRNDLQGQIDALNAGQNLADMVATKAALDVLPTTNLQTGDKVQVLADETHDSASTVYSLTKGENGDPDTWTYIGKYGQDSYTKSESDNKYFLKSNVIPSSTDPLPTSSDTQVPTFASVTEMIGDAGGAYVKLVSTNPQTIASSLTIKATEQATATLSIQDGQTVNANNTLTVTAGASPNHVVSTVYNATSGSYVVSVDNTSALSLATSTITVSGASQTVADVSGSMVASYRDYNNATLSDGRLVTVDYLTNYTGSMAAYAQLAANNTFASGYTNTFNGDAEFNGEVELNGRISGDNIYDTYTDGTWNTSSDPSDPADTAPMIPTVSAVNDAIEAKVTDLAEDVLIHISDTSEDEVGSMGLFIYTENDNSSPYKSGYTPSGAEKGLGAEVPGAYLKPVGMSLPMSGQISYKAANLVTPLSGTWKLLSIAMKRTLTEPCLVLAQKISDSDPA